MVGYFNRSSCPAGWTAANGNEGTPDLRGRFVRGVGGNSGALGALQEDAIRNITGRLVGDNEVAHSASGAFAFGGYTSGYGAENNSVASALLFDASLVAPTANENRPVNVALLACIKS